MGASGLKQSNLSLIREKLAEHRRDLLRLRAGLSEARNRANLLSNVRSDIDAYRASNPEAAEADYMLDERQRIESSHNIVDSVIGQAHATRDSFVVQRETIANINRRITMAASQVPGLNTLIGKISARKRRDSIIMGSFIAFCFVVFCFTNFSVKCIALLTLVFMKDHSSSVPTSIRGVSPANFAAFKTRTSISSFLVERSSNRAVMSELLAMSSLSKFRGATSVYNQSNMF